MRTERGSEVPRSVCAYVRKLIVRSVGLVWRGLASQRAGSARLHHSLMTGTGAASSLITRLTSDMSRHAECSVTPAPPGESGLSGSPAQRRGSTSTGFCVGAITGARSGAATDRVTEAADISLIKVAIERARDWSAGSPEAANARPICIQASTASARVARACEPDWVLDRLLRSRRSSLALIRHSASEFRLRPRVACRVASASMP